MSPTVILTQLSEFDVSTSKHVRPLSDGGVPSSVTWLKIIKILLSSLFKLNEKLICLYQKKKKVYTRLALNKQIIICNEFKFFFLF